MVLALYAFNVGLLFLCAYFAISTRNVPANFNEARPLSFATYNTLLGVGLITGLSYSNLPAYFAESQEYWFAIRSAIIARRVPAACERA